MKIDHIAIWTSDIEKMKDFYMKYFSITAGKIYRNQLRGFTSYFLRFSDGETRIELMHMDSITGKSIGSTAGLAHIAFSTGSREAVNQLTEKLRADGYRIISEPRTTGDGYYESAVADPEGNILEITV